VVEIRHTFQLAYNMKSKQENHILYIYPQSLFKIFCRSWTWISCLYIYQKPCHISSSFYPISYIIVLQVVCISKFHEYGVTGDNPQSLLWGLSHFDDKPVYSLVRWLHQKKLHIITPTPHLFLFNSIQESFLEGEKISNCIFADSRCPLSRERKLSSRWLSRKSNPHKHYFLL
jgi:hypothetical protein